MGNKRNLNPAIRVQYKQYISNHLERKCKVCGKLLLRTHYDNGCFENVSKYEKRNTCSNGLKKRTECYRIYYSGKNGSNYKGYMGTCVDCGKRTAYYTIKKAELMGKHNSDRCQKCFDKMAKKTNFFAERPQAKYIAERMRKRRGILPIGLIPFKKGHKSWLKGIKLPEKMKQKMIKTRCLLQNIELFYL